MPTDDIAEIDSDEVLISNGADVLGLMYGREENNIILHKKNITPQFFDLTTGVAGDVAQKLVNYRCRIAIVGDFSHIESKSLRDFIYESNRRGNIFFVATVAEARQKLSTA
ncbi:MAG: DUF4180 domain-containing protein [Turneriella sp.]|nr:DUF4180 domain-containing protein [Turneriella sp.]